MTHVTRRNGDAAVIMSLDDFKSYDETAYLMASPANAKRLDDSISDVEAGNVETHGLIKP